MTNGSSPNRLAFPFSNTCFPKNLRLVLITRSDMLGPLLVYLEEWCFFKFQEVSNNRFMKFTSFIAS